MSRTLHVHIGSEPDRSELEDNLGALEAGEEVEPRPSSLTVEGFETFQRVFRSTNLELLHAIAEHEPESIRELARIVGRHAPEVTENINELADYGLVELYEEGRAKRPVLRYDEIKVQGDISLRETGPDATPA